MTEYWVSQGNKWCDFCKIYIANNPASIRTHENGQRHKENVTKKLADIRKANALKEKEKQQALKDIQRIESQAQRSYQKDVAASATAVVAQTTETSSGTNVKAAPTAALKCKGKPSSLQVGKRKKPEKSKPISKEEEEALKAREAAKRRIQEREKGLMGLYQSY